MALNIFEVPVERRARLFHELIAHQSDHDRVALAGADSCLELAQDSRLLLCVAALGRAHVDGRNRRYDRVEVLPMHLPVIRHAAEHRFECGLLRCAHHELELGATRLRVDHLLEAVRALERHWCIPWLEEQHGVANRSNALSQVYKVGGDVGLTDHVVADPEEGARRVEPMLRDELIERVEQRRDRSAQKPRDKDVRLANVR